MNGGIEYLFSFKDALAQPATRVFLWIILGAFVAAPLVMLAVHGRMSEATRTLPGKATGTAGLTFGSMTSVTPCTSCGVRPS